MVQKLSIRDLKVDGKKVLMRVDFNVPLNSQGQITDDSRIVASLPSIKYVLDHGGSVILMSHLGRPKGKSSAEFTLKPCAKRLSELLNTPVLMAGDCVGDEVSAMASKLKPKQVLLLENLRFHKEEENPTTEFVKKLASLGDLYVNDAFGTAHRKHASTYTIASLFPGGAAAGLLMEKEIAFLGETLKHPKRPLVALIGGAKVSSKLGVLRSLKSIVDTLLIGGGMAYTFLKGMGVEIGNSLCEEDLVHDAAEILHEYQTAKKKLFLPVDHIAVDRLDGKANTVQVAAIPEGFQGVDIGEKTIKLFSSELKGAKTVLWNGPVGIFENPEFAHGTNKLAEVIASLDATTIVGGGDSVAAVNAAHLADKMTHISTGGGASLEYVEFGSLPGIDALSGRLKEHK
jgi:phosphoglycerate kinase